VSPTDPYSQHVVTAVIVGHDGAAWLAHGIDALLAQTKPVHRVVAVDTGSRDRSGAVLTAKLGQAAVFGMDRSTGYAAAVRRALQHKTTSAQGTDQGGRGREQPVEWIWLLHDDCEPAPDALEQLLRGAAEVPAAAVLGPKLKDWTDRNVILEAGLGLDSVGRRITGVEPREVDQGQHDGDRDVLGVSSAGMLVRRDVWDQVGGFDPGMTLFGEDIDLCWRVHAAGFRVRVITDAVVYHAMAATRGRRPISVGRRARLLQRRHALQTLLGNLPTGPMILSLVANLAISFIRTVFYAVAKRGTAALDEAAAVAAVVGHPMRFAAARRRRARGRRNAYSRVRADLPPGHSFRRAAEFVALVLSKSATAEHAARRSAIDDPTDDDSLLTDSGVLQRFITRPGVLLMIAIIVVTGVAERSLIAGGPLGGGALLPAWEGASTLWGEVLRAYHPSGVGSASAAPPYAGFVALLATILLGKVWLAIDVLLLAAVPLAGLTALRALRPVTSSSRVRVWAAAAYALLPVASGAVAAGRLGSAVAFVLIPLIGLQAGRMFSEAPRRARRAAWATGLSLTVGAAFVPLLWPMALAGAVIAAATLRRSRPRLINLGIVAATPLVLLLPWMLQQLAHPSLLLLEAGVQQPGLAAPDLPARSLLLLSPGGPGLPPYWVSAALLVTGLAALLASRRRMLVVAGWSVALLGFATAVLASRTIVTPPGGQAMTPWPGPALAVAAAGLILAAAAGAEGLGRSVAVRGRKSARSGGGLRRAGVVVLSLAGASAPLLAAAYWLMNGVDGPIGKASGQVVPALAAPATAAQSQLRTLVLTSTHGHVSYVLLRGDSPELTDSGLVPPTAAQTALSQAVGALVAPGGDQAASQGQLLANFDIGFVLMRAPLDPSVVSALDEVAGLSPFSITPDFDLWRVTPTPSRVSVVEPNGAVVPVPSGAIGVSGATAPAAGGILELAEPAGGWTATLNGHTLTPISSPAGSWAQAFRLPPGGGTLAIGRSGLIHDLVTGLELLAFLLVAVLALPGVRTAAELEAGAASAAQSEEAEAEAVPVTTGGPPALRRVPARAGRAARAARGGSRTGRRRQAPQPDGGAAADPPARRGAGRPLRAGASRAGTALTDSGRSAGRRAKAGLPDAASAGGRAAGAVGAAADGTVAGAGAGVAAGAGAAASRAGAGRAAWPAGQPSSRFLSGPPAGASSADSGPGRTADAPSRGQPSPAGPPYDDRRGRSPAGGRYDEVLPGGAAEPREPYSGQPYSGEPYSGEPYSGQPYPDQPYPDQPYSDQPYSGRPSAPRSPSGAASAPRSPSGTPYRDEPWDTGRREPDRPGRDWAPPPQPGRGPASRPDREQPPASGWPSAEPGRPRHPGSRASSWPEPERQHGWPQESRPGYQARPVPEQAPAWTVPDQGGWPEQGESLEALPPVEAHHDWSAREERQRRGWLAPEDEADEDTW
jgi:GT2 family glycosyltransferase